MTDALYEKTEAFCALYGDDRLSAICEAYYTNGSEAGTYGDITFSDIVRHDAINATLYGYFAHDGEEICFQIDDGNWAGTVVREFGEDTNLTPPAGHTRRLFDTGPGIGHGSLPSRTALLDLYLGWTQGAHMPEFRKMESDYAYDAHFAPGLKTSTHYRDWATQKGLVLASAWIEDDARA